MIKYKIKYLINFDFVCNIIYFYNFMNSGCCKNARKNALCSLQQQTLLDTLGCFTFKCSGFCNSTLNKKNQSMPELKKMISQSLKNLKAYVPSLKWLALLCFWVVIIQHSSHLCVSNWQKYCLSKIYFHTCLEMSCKLWWHTVWMLRSDKWR